MDRSALDEQCGRFLGDPSHSRWTTDVLHTRYELSQQKIQALTGAVKTTETLTPTANTAEVQVNADTLDIVRVTLTESDGTINVIEGRTREDLDFYEPTWPNLDSGKPVTFYFDASNQNLILVPPPSSTYAITNALKVWEVRIPTALTTDSSVPFNANNLMRAYHMAIVHDTVATCFIDNGDPESLGKSKFHRTNDMDNPGEFEKYLRMINAKFDNPSDIPARVMWYPQGGRRWNLKAFSKADPLGTA